MKFNFDTYSRVNPEQVVATVQQLKQYEKLLATVSKTKKYNFPESFIKLPFDEELVTKVLKLKEKVMKENFDQIVVIGIGGSNLGTKAIYDALLGYADLVEPTRKPKMLFVDTLAPAYVKKVGKLCATSKSLIILVTKSGTTTESLYNFQILAELAPKSKVIVIANEYSKLADKARKQGFHVLGVPQLVGGRYSVFSAVGLFPLACAGVDILSLCEGGMRALSDLEGAEISASIILAHYRNGKDILTDFFFDSRLEALGKWHRQLIAESLGKKDYCGNPHGLTPEVSIGTTDMHSMLQLYLSGKNNRQYCFVRSSSKGGNKIAKKATLTDAQVLAEIYKHTKDVFEDKGLPFVENELASVSETELGYFMHFKMLEVIFLARLLNVNAFDQPDVEDYKRRAPVKAPF